MSSAKEEFHFIRQISTTTTIPLERNKKLILHRFVADNFGSVVQVKIDLCNRVRIPHKDRLQSFTETCLRSFLVPYRANPSVDIALDLEIPIKSDALIIYSDYPYGGIFVEVFGVYESLESDTGSAWPTWLL